MQVIYNIQSDTFNSNTGVGLGNFDGLHIGHMALINTLISECKLNGLSSVVYTFEGIPILCLGKNHSVQLLQPISKNQKFCHPLVLITFVISTLMKSIPK